VRNYFIKLILNKIKNQNSFKIRKKSKNKFLMPENLKMHKNILIRAINLLNHPHKNNSECKELFLLQEEFNLLKKSTDSDKTLNLVKTFLKMIGSWDPFILMIKTLSKWNIKLIKNEINYPN
jgi:hypothetical protein